MSTKKEIIASAEIIDAEFARLREVERRYNRLIDEQTRSEKKKKFTYTLTEEELQAMRDEQLKKYDDQWAHVIKKLNDSDWE